MTDDISRSSLNVRVSEDLRSQVEEAVEERGFANRSEFVRSVLWDAVQAESDVTEQARDVAETSPRADATPFETVAERLRDGPDRPERLAGGASADRASRDPDAPLDAVIEREDALGFEESLQDGDVDVRVIGCGGAGIHIIDKLHGIGAPNARTVTIDTDEEDLDLGASDTRALIGKSTFEGEGSDGDVDAVREAGERVTHALAELVDEPDLVFVLTGLGGGTGTALAPQVAELASGAGAVVVTVGVLPFSLEREKRARARDGIERLRPLTDTLAVIDGNLIKASNPELGFGHALERMHEDVARVVARITSHIGEFRVGEHGQSLLQMLDDGGYSVLLESRVSLDDPSGTDSSELLSDRLLQYSNVDLDEDHIETAILLFEAGENVPFDVVDDVINHVHDWTREIAWYESRGGVDPDQLGVFGILTGIDADVEDIVASDRTATVTGDGIEIRTGRMKGASGRGRETRGRTRVPAGAAPSDD